MNTAPHKLSNGRYRLVSRLAVGGMGEVWRAVDELLGRDVAIKILKDEYAHDESFRTRFRAEARNTAGLSHPGIARMYDYGEQEDLAYLVMELVPGQPLSEILARNGRLSAEVTLDIITQASRALQSAHEAGLIHRDIKPGNLIVDPNGTVKVTDFGIARVVDAATMTQTGTVLGTAQYVSPEQAEGRVLTPATDLYSLGIVAYECLTGHAPFTGESAVAIALAQVRDQPPPLPADVPAGVRELVARCLAKNTINRPASAGELGDFAALASESLRLGDAEAGYHDPHTENFAAGGPAEGNEAEGASALSEEPSAEDTPEGEGKTQGWDVVAAFEDPTKEPGAVDAGLGMPAGDASTQANLGASGISDTNPTGEPATRKPERRHVLIMAGAMGVAIVCAGALTVGFGWEALFQQATHTNRGGPPLITDSPSTRSSHTYDSDEESPIGSTEVADRSEPWEETTEDGSDEDTGDEYPTPGESDTTPESPTPTETPTTPTEDPTTPPTSPPEDETTPPTEEPTGEPTATPPTETPTTPNGGTSNDTPEDTGEGAGTPDEFQSTQSTIQSTEPR